MYSIMASADTFLANLSNLQQRMGTANRQVSSGLRVQNVSDDPSSVVDILELNTQIQSNNQLGLNLGKVQTEVNAGEGAINSATTLMDQAQQLGAEGATATTSTGTRAQLAAQVSDLITEMQGLANSQVQGRYIFSGDSDQTAAFGAVDLTKSNGVGAYLGTPSTRVVQGPNGTTIPLALTAQDIFDGGTGGTPSNSVLQSLTELYNALSSNNTTAVTQAVTDVSSSSTYLSTQQARYGDIQNRISGALSYQSILNTNLGAELSSVQDSDAAQAITTLQSDTVAEQAAMSAYNSIPKKSLFDYLG